MRRADVNAKYHIGTVHATVPIVGGVVDIANPFTDSTPPPQRSTPRVSGRAAESVTGMCVPRCCMPPLPAD
jgi:hypothetical protein